MIVVLELIVIWPLHFLLVARFDKIVPVISNSNDTSSLLHMQYGCKVRLASDSFIGSSEDHIH